MISHNTMLSRAQQRSGTTCTKVVTASTTRGTLRAQCWWGSSGSPTSGSTSEARSGGDPAQPTLTFEHSLVTL